MRLRNGTRHRPYPISFSWLFLSQDRCWLVCSSPNVYVSVNLRIKSRYCLKCIAGLSNTHTLCCVDRDMKAEMASPSFLIIISSKVCLGTLCVTRYGFITQAQMKTAASHKDRQGGRERESCCCCWKGGVTTLRRKQPSTEEVVVVDVVHRCLFTSSVHTVGVECSSPVLQPVSGSRPVSF